MASMIIDLKPYPAMKDSGVEWLGKVPAHWIELPLKRIARIDNSGKLRRRARKR